MAWPNPFYKKTPNTRTCWSYTFELTDDHLTPEQAYPLKYSYDTLAEECLTILNDISPPNQSDTSKYTGQSTPSQTTDNPQKSAEDTVPTKKSKPKRDLFILLRDHRHEHAKLQELWDQVHTIPPWVDWEQISRGQDVFYRYGGATLTGLAYQSLLGGMGANRVVEVLARTGGFGVKVARHRLFETTQHILSCTKSLKAIQPGGEGFSSSIKVRLLHASVRQRILKLAATRPDYYSVEKFGIPINDLDSIGTIGTFSTTIVYHALPRQGIFPTQREIIDYIALWRLIAHYMGTPTDFFSTPARAKAMMESLLMHEINPSQLSATLANNVIRCLENQPPAYASRSFLEANARWLNGDQICDALHLGHPSFYHRSLVAGQCIFFMALTYFYRLFPSLDRRKIESLKKAFWQVIVESKYGLQGEETVFEFKHIPQFDTVTYIGGDEGAFKGHREVEARNLRALVLGLVAVGGVGYGGWKMSVWVVRGVGSLTRFAWTSMNSLVSA